MAHFCAMCGEALRSDIRFCPACGSGVDPSAELDGLHRELLALQAAPAADAALRLGHRLLDAHDPPAALIAFQAALASASDLAEAHLALAVVHLQQEAPAAARPHLVAAIEHGTAGPLTASARAYLAMLLLEEFDIGGAQTELAQAEREDPHNFLVLWKRGEYYYRLGMYPEAERVLHAATRLRAPSKSSALFVSQLLESSREKASRSFTRQPLLPRWAEALRRRTAM